MEMEDIHATKRSRIGNGTGDGGANAHSAAAAAAKLAQEQRQDEDEEDGEGRSLLGRGGGGALGGVRGLRPWNQHSTASRIYRVSRASGGKDRHSKVMTAKGLRDRRVRLSVSTAIQFYDLQDRLGVDQPSKAIEWLIKAAAEAISDLPSLDGAFSDQPQRGGQPGHDEKPDGTGEDEQDADVSQLPYNNHHHLQHQQEEEQHQQQRQPQQRLSLTKSTCSSTSETSKGSVLSLSRSEIRVKARERARERTATVKDKEKDKDIDIEDDGHIPSATHHQSMNLNPASQSSFTELLTAGGHQNHTNNHGPVTVAQASLAPNFMHRQLRHMPTPATADYFGQVGLLGTGQKPHQPSIFPTQSHFGNNSAMGMVPFNFAAAAAAAAASTGDHPELQQHYMQEHLIPFAVTAAGGDYINFSISSGFNRGTLQSNSPSPALHHHLQMFSSPVDASNLPFFLGAAAQAASGSGEGQLPAGFDSRLQLCHRHPDLKGKGKN